MAAIVVAGAGVPVCKHGARAASSKCGTADVLEALGVVVELTPNGVRQCVERAGIGFCFAPRFHPAFRFAAPSRREIGIPTVFNLLGPMANPGRVRRQLIGVANPAYAERMLQSLRHHGSTDAWVVHGNGLDELSTTGPSSVLALRDGEVEHFEIDAASIGLPVAVKADLAGGEPHENAGAVRRVLAGERGPHRDIVVLNAAAALIVAGHAESLAAGAEQAAETIDSGRACRDARRLRTRVAGRRRCRELTGERQALRRRQARSTARSQFACRPRRPTSAPVSTRSAWRSRCTPRSASATRPPGASPVDHHHPAADRVRPVGRRRHAVGAVADPDGTWARLQRRRPGRRCGGSASCSGSGRGGESRPARSTRSSPWRPTLEGHADNVAASLLGGVVATAGGRAIRVPLGFDPAVVVWIPAVSTSTEHSRNQLPATVSRDDAVHNIGHVAMLVAALAVRRHRRAARRDQRPPAPGAAPRRRADVAAGARRRARARGLVRVAERQRADDRRCCARPTRRPGWRPRSPTTATRRCCESTTTARSAELMPASR